MTSSGRGDGLDVFAANLSGAEPHERRHSERADGDNDGDLLCNGEWHGEIN
jgi:hypothetical protein